MKSANHGVTAIVFSDNIGNMLSLSDYNDYVTEYGHPTIAFQQTAGKFHDRYIILDYKTKTERIYHCGASSKDAGKRTTSISLVADKENYHGMIEMLLKNQTLY